MTMLHRFHIDQLPPLVRGRAQRAVKNAIEAGHKISERLDKLISEDARSPLLDEAELTQEGQQRKEALKRLQRDYPGNWRGHRP